MGNQLLASKVVVYEEQPALQQIAGVLTAVLGLAGVTEWGPIGTARLVQSPSEYKRLYGGYTLSGEVAQAVEGFFLNGGQQLYVSRVVHCTDPTDPSTKSSAAATKNLTTDAIAATSGSILSSLSGPFDFVVTGKTLITSIDGAGNQTTTITGVAATRLCANAGTYDLANNDTLTVTLDGGDAQTITFVSGNFVDIDAATAAEVVAVINGQLVGGFAAVDGGKVRITSDRKGTGSGVNVTGGTANAAFGFTTGNVAGSGNVSDLSAVTVAEIVAALDLVVTGATVSVSGGYISIVSDTSGASSSVLVQSASTADALVGLDNATHTGTDADTLDTLQIDAKWDGTYGNELSIRIAAATSGDAARFNLTVVRNGVNVEVWPNLSMDSSDPRYVETIINDDDVGSMYITATDLAAATPSPYDRPVNGLFGPLTGGNNGLTSLGDNDFIGGTSSNGRVGMRALDTVADLTLLAIPGRATSAVHNAMLTYCEITRGMAVFALLDPPSNCNAEEIVEYVETTAALLELSEFGAVHWPRIAVRNPNKTVFGNDKNIYAAPSGYVAGVLARGDSSVRGGVYQPAAGITRGVVFGCLGFEGDDTLDENKRDLVYPKNINPITTGRGLPRFIDGTRTLKSTGNFPGIAERRGAIFIEQSIKDGLQIARHRNNDETLRAEASRVVETFLTTQMNNGAFRTKDPATAFFVDFGRGLNSDAVVFAHQLLGRIGLATNKSIDWVVLGFSQDTRAVDNAA